jgi:hypothetical protein
MKLKRLRLMLGGAAWIAVVCLAVFGLQRESSSSEHGPTDVLRDVSHWVLDQRTEFRAQSTHNLLVAIGDPVLMRLDDGSFQQVGVVRRTGGPDRKAFLTSSVNVLLYDSVADGATDGLMLEYHSTPTSLDWVVKTMISPEKQVRIADLIAADWAIHQAEVVEKLRPVLRESVSRAVDAIESQLPVALRRHRDEFTQVGERYQAEILEKEVVPLVRQFILPVAMEEIRPVAAEIGEALWRKVSIWRFTWRYLYDVSPLPSRDAVKVEFKRFMETEAIPELEARSDHFVATAEKIVSRVSRDPDVQRIIRRNLKTVAEDPQLRDIVWQVLRESILENHQLYTALDEYWQSDETRMALKVASSSFEPTVRKIGDMVFGTRDKGVSPEFARILRLQILTKDRRWFLLRTARDNAQQDVARGSIPITIASEPMPFPIEFDALLQSPLTHASVPPPSGSPQP